MPLSLKEMLSSGPKQMSVPDTRIDEPESIPIQTMKDEKSDVQDVAEILIDSPLPDSMFELNEQTMQTSPKENLRVRFESTNERFEEQKREHSKQSKRQQMIARKEKLERARQKKQLVEDRFQKIMQFQATLDEKFGLEEMYQKAV